MNCRKSGTTCVYNREKSYYFIPVKVAATGRWNTKLRLCSNHDTCLVFLKFILSVDIIRIFTVTVTSTIPTALHVSITFSSRSTGF